MNGIYDIFCKNLKVGKAEVSKEGLYYCFQCQCHLPDTTLYQIYIICGGRRESLGVLVPNKHAFSLFKRLPIKYFPQGEPQFIIEQRRICHKEIWIPVTPDSPFPYISKLENATLEYRNGRAGIIIPEETVEEKQDNDQIRAPQNG